MHVTRCRLIILLAVVLMACGAPGQSGTSSDPIVVGVSGPLTGPNAQYGAQWKQGFDLALDEINGAGGINGLNFQY
jgi:branched-chain amino acid transport system substrate-binding protein